MEQSKKPSYIPVINAIPADVEVADKPDNIEDFRRSKSETRWANIVKSLPIIDPRKCVIIPIKGLKKTRIYTIKKNIRDCAKRYKINGEIRFAIKDDRLWIWLNRF